MPLLPNSYFPGICPLLTYGLKRSDIVNLPASEMIEAHFSEEKAHLFISGVINLKIKVILLMTADLKSVAIPLSEVESYHNGMALEIVDGGKYLKFGDKRFSALSLL